MKIAVLGAGGQARVVIEALRFAGSHEIIGALDDGELREVLGVPVLGRTTIEDAHRLGVEGVALGIGNNAVRSTWFERFATRFEVVSAVHPTAFVSPTAEVGPGCYVGPHAVLHTQAALETGVILNSGAIVEHDCRIGACAHIAPGAVLCGAVRVGARTLVGAGARVIPGIVIGTDATVGAGAVVVRPVEDGETWIGVPAGRRER